MAYEAHFVARGDLVSDGGDDWRDIVLYDRQRVVSPACLEFDGDYTVVMLLQVGSDRPDMLFCVPASSDEDDAQLARHVNRLM